MLIVGHPGHELRVHGWLEEATPVVMVLTDGSGHHGISRLGSTAAVVARAGAAQGAIFGRFTDAGLYRALLDRDLPTFVALAEEVALAMKTSGIAVVAGDDTEGYNPTHDVCRLIVDAAVAVARHTYGLDITNLAFALMEHPRETVSPAPHERLALRLDDGALGRKMAAAAGYPEMADEVERARARWGDEAFRTEAFRVVTAGEPARPGDQPPYYERHGAERVTSGAYADVIRYDAHIRPVAEALAAWARRPAK